MAQRLETSGSGVERAMRPVSDSDTMRRQNRGLVLEAIRRVGPLSRTRLATETGLSHASITTIVGDLIEQNILTDQAGERSGNKSRGRPAVQIGFNRTAGYALLIELDVNKVRCSLIDYSGTMTDRIEFPLTPETFGETPPVDYLAACITRIRERNAAEAGRLLRVAISVQGILDRNERGLKWSPVPHMTGHDLVGGLESRFHLPIAVYKRGRLLAEGVRWLFPELRDTMTAMLFVGSTVGMGLSMPGSNIGNVSDAATEFGHMLHVPDGALCRCGTRGCIEAYAADYGVLRATYGVPERTPPAPAVPPEQYDQLIAQAQRGDRNAIHAFNIAGQAVGYGLNRLMTVFNPTDVLIVGPGTKAFPFMRAELETAIGASLTAEVHGPPRITTHEDESEPVFKGLTMKALIALDQDEFAALPHAG